MFVFAIKCEKRALGGRDGGAGGVNDTGGERGVVKCGTVFEKGGE